MKVTVKQSWRPFCYIVSLGKLTYEGTKDGCEQIAKGLRSRINRSGRKTKKNILTDAVRVAIL